MTAVCIVAQPKYNCIHFAGDAAMYETNQTIVAFGSKAFPVAHWPGLVTTAGNGAMVPLFGWSLAQEFATFDDAVANAEAKVPELASAYQLPSGAQFFFVGISKERGPEAYVSRTDDRLPPGATVEDVRATGFWGRPYELIRLPDQIQSPVPNDVVLPANWDGFDPDDPPATMLWSIRKMLTMQRQTKLADGYGAIGGFGQVTTIYPDRIEQRILCHWSEDKIGAPLRPAPLDWSRWHADNPKPGGNVSRLTRDMADHRMRKHLRSV